MTMTAGFGNYKIEKFGECSRIFVRSQYRGTDKRENLEAVAEIRMTLSKEEI